MVCATSAALLFGFSHSVWSQSVIAERHTMNAFLVTAFLACGWLALVGARGRAVLAAAFATGVAIMTSHKSLLLLPALALLAGLADRRLLLALVAMTGVTAMAGAYFAFVTLRGWLAAGAIALWCCLGLVAARRLSRGWAAMGIVGCLCSGLSLVFYIAFASEQNPPINWGCARTPAGFLHMIRLGQFERVDPLIALARPTRVLALAGNYVRLLAEQFMLLPLVAGFIPLFVMGTGDASLRRWRRCVAATWVLMGPVWMIAMNPQADIQTQLIVRPHLVPSYAAYALCVGQGLFLLVSRASRRACNRLDVRGY